MGVPGFNAVTHFLLREFLSKHGLEPGKDYTLLQARRHGSRGFWRCRIISLDATLCRCRGTSWRKKPACTKPLQWPKAISSRPTGAIVVREEMLRSDPALIEQFSARNSERTCALRSIGAPRRSRSSPQHQSKRKSRRQRLRRRPPGANERRHVQRRFAKKRWNRLAESPQSKNRRPSTDFSISPSPKSRCAELQAKVGNRRRDKG